MANVMEFPDTVEEFMNLYKVVDSDHVYSNGVEFIPIYRMKQWFEHLQPKSNGDRIRSMSDEEFSHFLFGIQCAPASRPKEWLDWLKQEAGE